VPIFTILNVGYLVTLLGTQYICGQMVRYQWKVNWKKGGRKHLWPSLWYYHSICLEVLTIPMKKLTIISNEISAGHILWIYVSTTNSDDGGGSSETFTRQTICSKTHMVSAIQRKCRLCFNSDEHSSVLQSQNHIGTWINLVANNMVGMARKRQAGQLGTCSWVC